MSVTSDLTRLHQTLDTRLDQEELRTLCFELGIDYDSLRGEGKTNKVRELVTFLDRRDSIPELLKIGQKMRPDIPWAQLPTADEDLPPSEQRPPLKGGAPVDQRPPIVLTNDAAQAETPSQEMTESTSAETGTGSTGRVFSKTVGGTLALSGTLDVFVEPADRVLLTTVGGTQIYVHTSPRLWQMPVDVFVLPMGTSPGGGRLTRTFLADVGPSGDLAFNEALERAFRDLPSSRISPDAPLLMRLPDEVTADTIPQHVIAATAFALPGENEQRLEVDHSATAAAAVVRLAAENGLGRIALPLIGGGEAGLPPGEVATAMLRAVLDVLPDTRVAEITFAPLGSDAIDAMRQVVGVSVLHLPQRLVNDLARGPDYLNVSEADSLAQMLALRDLEPPFVVGVLGGWGSGKSFAMHLIQQRMAAIRSLPVTKALAWPDGSAAEGDGYFPYVGHIYPIRFDAWTYAKSNLWASLMQTIFFELSRQLALEKWLEEANVSPYEGGAVWQALSLMDEDERKTLLEDELAPEIFEQLEEQGIAGQQDLRDRLWTILQDLKETERQDLQKMEEDLAALRLKLETKEEHVKREVDEKLEQEARDAAWVPVEEALKEPIATIFKRLKQLVPSEMGETVGDASQTSQLFGLKPAVKDLCNLIRHNLAEFMAFLIFAGIAAVMPFVITWAETFQFPGLVLSAAALLSALLRTLNRWQGLVTESYNAYQEQVQAERERLMAERAQREAEQRKQREIPKLEQQIKDQEAQVERQRRRVGMTSDHVSLLDFVNARLDKAYYEKQLGLMHQVRRDLDELSTGLTVGAHDPHAGMKRELFPRGPARVVLFIDDLDRCPPERVVEVLEATQLLVKTPLFVVVLAIDVRYITRALEKRYRDILTRRGDPSGLDYIEKIIQVPYQVRPIQPEALPGYLSSQMRVEAAKLPPEPPVDRPQGGDPPSQEEGETVEPTPVPAPAPAPVSAQPAQVLTIDVVEFSQREFELVRTCCQHINLTPRAVKRLVNVYKVLKILWFLDSGHRQPDWDVERTVILLLGFSGRFPDVMRDVFEALESALALKSETPLVEFFETFELPYRDPYVDQKWERLLNKLRALAPSGSETDITLNRMDLPTFDLVRSFSFVGEIGYEPGDLRLVAEREKPSANP